MIFIRSKQKRVFLFVSNFLFIVVKLKSVYVIFIIGDVLYPTTLPLQVIFLIFQTLWDELYINSPIRLYLFLNSVTFKLLNIVILTVDLIYVTLLILVNLTLYYCWQHLRFQVS
jgi:hypothetical protein